MNGGVEERRSARAFIRIAAEMASLAAVVLVGCTPAPPKSRPNPVGACALSAAAAPDSLSIAILPGVDPGHVPVPSTVAERMVFAQLYSTLLDVSCDGQPRPALARSWTLDASRTRVTLVLRDDARFGSGAALGASDVVAAWRATGESSGEWGALARRLVQGSTVVDDHTLLISVPDTNLRVLAAPALAVYRPNAASPWPDGSGAYRVSAASAAELTLLPTTAAGGPQLDIHMMGGDPRDAIDGGADVVITSDPAAISYAGTAGGHTVVPLPWRRTYLLAAPVRVAIPAMPMGDAVHEDSRPAAQPGWLAGIKQCQFDIVHPGPPHLPSPDRRIAYESGDDVARQLAERLVALGVAPAADRMSRPELDAALGAESTLAYVISVPTQSMAPCITAAALLEHVPWLSSDSSSSVGTLAPLVDTRLHVIVRTDRVPAAIDWDGAMH